MIHYRDKTYCSAQCAFTACHRNKRNVPAQSLIEKDYSATCPQYEPVVKNVGEAEVAA